MTTKAFVAAAAGVMWLTVAGPSLAADAADVRVVPLSSLGSRDAALLLVSSAVATGARALVVPVSLFAEPPSALADVVALARAQKLSVVAAIDVTLAAGANEWPADREHVVYTHPEWLMVPRELSRELARLDVRSPDYAGRLARWARANAGIARGLYLSPVHRDTAKFVADAVRVVVQRYGFDGVQFEAARYPSLDFDYSRSTLDALRQEIRPTLSADDRRRMDAAEALDPFAYADEFPTRWQRFRQVQLTALIVRVRTAVKSVKPSTLVSAVVSADPARALSEHLQDWSTWLDNRFVDTVTPDTQDESTRQTSAFQAAPGAPR